MFLPLWGGHGHCQLLGTPQGSGCWAKGVFGLPAWAPLRLGAGTTAWPWLCVVCAGPRPTGRDPASLGTSSAPATGEQAAAGFVLQPASLCRQPGALMPASPVLAGPGPVWAGVTAPHSGCGSPRGGVWVQQLLGPALGHLPVPWPQALPSQFTHFSPLISGLSIHCPQSSDGETEARKHKSCVESGQGPWLPIWRPPGLASGDRAPGPPLLFFLGPGG